MKYREIADGIFVDRPNRFIAHVEVNGAVETVHVKNTGRCKELLLPGTAVRLEVSDTGMSYVIPWGSIPKDLQEPLHRYVSEAEGKLCGYCKEELCNSESGRMVVELYLGRQDGHSSRILY